jgi:hypothetical protein
MAWTLGAMLKTCTAVNYNRKRLSGQCKYAVFTELVSLKASVTLHTITLESLTKDKQSSILDPFVSYK